MNIKKKNFILIIILTIAGTLLFTCGIFAVVTKSVSFNLALKLDPQIYFSLSMRIDYDGDGSYTGTHPNDDQISESTQYTIFNNSANAQGLVSWATVNQNCIVLNQVLAGNILSNLTVNSRFEITVTNLTNNNGNEEYLNLTLNYNGAEEVFKADNGYGAVNMKYNSTDEETKGTKIFTLIPQTTLLDGYIQIPFLAEIDTEKRYTASITTIHCEVVNAKRTFTLGNAYTAEFRAPDIYCQSYSYDVTIAGVAYKTPETSALLQIPASVVTGDIVINAVACELWDGSVAENFAGGNGTETTPYLISNGAELALMSYLVNNQNTATTYGDVTTCGNLSGFGYAHYEQISDIYLNDETFTFIPETGLVHVTDGINTCYLGTGIAGTAWFVDSASEMGAVYNTCYTKIAEAPSENSILTYSSGNTTSTINYWTAIGNVDFYFRGGYNGGLKAINQIYVNNSYGWQGLFGRTCDSVIQNTSIVNGYIRGRNAVGCISGYPHNATITNSYNKSVVIGEYDVGGICGYSTNLSSIVNCYNMGVVHGDVRNIGGVVGGMTGVITNCYNAGMVFGHCVAVGGVLGRNDSGTIIDSYNIGVVVGFQNSVGGVCGYNLDTITNSYNKGGVSGAYDIGGVCGYNPGIIDNCYNTGSVSGISYVGGVSGDNIKGVITNCYNIGDVKGENRYIGGISGRNNNSYATITNCYNVGTVSGSYRVGGVCGYFDSGTISYCYYLSGCATDGSGKVQLGIGVETQGSAATNDTPNVTTSFDSAGTLTTNATFTDGYSTNVLRDALQAWVDDQNSEDYNSWAVGNLYPVFAS